MEPERLWGPTRVRVGNKCGEGYGSEEAELGTGEGVNGRGDVRGEPSRGGGGESQGSGGRELQESDLQRWRRGR